MEVRRKKRSEKGTADKMGRPEGVDSHTDQSVLASQGWLRILGGSSRIRTGVGDAKGEQHNTHTIRPTKKDRFQNLGV